MALQQLAVSLNNSTAVQLITDPIITDPVTGEKNYTFNSSYLLIQNNDVSAVVYLGTSAVTAGSYGTKLPAGSSVSIDNVGGQIASQLYAISSVASSVVNILMVA